MNVDHVMPLICTRSGEATLLFEQTWPTFGYNLTDHDQRNSIFQHESIAMIAFLNEYQHNYYTLRCYASEIERFYLWLRLIKQRSIGEFCRNDLSEYMNFLGHPPVGWSAPSSKKFSPDGSLNPSWRPFKTKTHGSNGLSNKSIERSKKILQTMFAYLVDIGYLRGNPISPTINRSAKRKRQLHSIINILTPPEVLFIEKCLRKGIDEFSLWNSDSISALRRFFVFELYLYSGLTISEPLPYTMGDIQSIQNADKTAWFIDVRCHNASVGKIRRVAIGKLAIDALDNFYRALNSYNRASDNVKDFSNLSKKHMPLIPSLSIAHPVSERFVSIIFEEIRTICLKTIEHWGNSTEVDADISLPKSVNRETIKNFTCNWLRHTHAAYTLAVKNDIEATRDQLGHADLSVTQRYLESNLKFSVLQDCSPEFASRFRL